MFGVQATLIIMGCVHFKAAFFCNTGETCSHHVCLTAEFTLIDTVFSDISTEETIDSSDVLIGLFIVEVQDYSVMLSTFLLD